MRDAKPRMLAVITARGGSKGLPGKNIRPLAGMPLLAHSIKLARMCPEIDRLILSTDSEEIAEVGRRYGCDVPFMRPAELARSDTPTWPVMRHALEMVEREERRRYDLFLLLDPTSPTRLPEDVHVCFRRMCERPEADGIVSVSEPHFNPIWHGVVEKDGWFSPLFAEGEKYTRRQDLPRIYRIVGLLYLWRTAYLRAHESWKDREHHLLHVVPELRATSFDTLEEFESAQALIRQGIIKLPWLDAEVKG